MKTKRFRAEHLRVKYLVITTIFALFVSCSRTDYPAPTIQSMTASVSPTIVSPTIEATAVPSPTATNKPQPNPPTIDGVLSSGEWDTAVVENLTDDSELLLMQDDDYLYLGIRSITPEMIGANVFIEKGGQVRILHTSAALGTAVYQQNTTNWQQTQNFDWQCRDTSNSESAQAERAAYLQENHWLAANSRMGTPNELEYQIELKDTAPRIAVSVFRSSSPDERAFWPPTLNDDSIQPSPGGLPENLNFTPEQWSVLEVK